MAEKNLLILERSSQNLQKISRNGKTVLEGVFAEFGVENRNGRIYEEKEYLPHLEYLKKDIANGNLLGELDHPERFEVALNNVSHRITDLWYDPQKRQVLGRVEILEGTPKGQIAKALLEAGVPLSISSRAAGSVNEDKRVKIEQIYTFDLVAKPGFESATLYSVNESGNARSDEINKILRVLNESAASRNRHSLNSEFGIVNENVSIIDLTDKYPQLKLREEAKMLSNKNNENKMSEVKSSHIDEAVLQQWTELFKRELNAINKRLDEMEQSKSDVSQREITAIKKYIEKIRKIQEDSLNWQSDIAKSVNEVADYADRLAKKSNIHYNLTKKIAETVDYNAKVLNHTQDWTEEIANVTNAIGETVDHNAEMLNELNEWTGEIARGVNKLNEWGEEKAKAINDMHDWVSSIAKTTNAMHEWTSSIAKNVNNTINWAEEMFGRAISKEEAMKLIKYVELVNESKSNPELKKKIDEMLRTHSITHKPLNESQLKGIMVIDTVNKIKGLKDEEYDTKNNSVEFDEKTKTIVSKLRNISVKKEKNPLGKDDLQMNPEKEGGKLPKDQIYGNLPKGLENDLQKHNSIKTGNTDNVGNVKGSQEKNQNLKLDTKPELKESIRERRFKLDEKLERIIQNLENEKKVDEQVKSQYPFTQLLSESDRKKFAALDITDKQKVADEVSKVPTTDPKVILKLWENALAPNKTEEPLWLKLAPKAYKEAFNKAPQSLQESIKAKAEFFTLNTQYQIDNFWETSGLISRPVITLNEVVTAKSPKESEQKLDSLVAYVGEQMKRWSH